MTYSFAFKNEQERRVIMLTVPGNWEQIIIKEQKTRKTIRYTIEKPKIYTLIERLTGFNGMSIHPGLVYAERLRNLIISTFM